ncbi:MAG: sensor histidine kinase [Anaerolineae bacterium]|nr:MAG: sensor histidine kinase [Anaerolineae bacterium]
MEPGLLQVFRMYALLRAALAVFAILIRWAPASPAAETPISFWLVGLIFLLVLYLYSGLLQKRLKQLYLPIGLLLAAFSLLTEQIRFSTLSFLGQGDPFFFILLILVSWQYRFPGVIVFVGALSGLELLLNTFYPPVFVMSLYVPPDRIAVDAGTPGLRPEAQVLLVRGRLVSRTLSLTIVGLVVSLLARAQKNQRDELTQANQQLRQFAATLEQLATSRERNRLSRELHDTLAHTLSALTVQLEALQTTWRKLPTKANRLIGAMLNQTRQGLQETRRALQDLRAAPLEELGLALAIQNLVEDVGIRNSLKTTVVLEPEVLRVPQNTEQSFYRVAQEALQNVVRHARADSVEVSLIQYDAQLELVVADNGIGFAMEADANGDGLGLQMMRERAQLVGGKLEISSAHGAGTVVRLRV